MLLAAGADPNYLARERERERERERGDLLGGATATATGAGAGATTNNTNTNTGIPGATALLYAATRNRTDVVQVQCR